MYEVSVDVDRQLVVLSVYVLNTFNAYMSEVNMKKLSDTDWILMRLKKEIAVVLLIKLMFVWIVKNQSVRD